MATSAVPNVIGALVTLAAASLPNIIVSDGYAITDSPGDFLMVGVEDPETVTLARSAQASQSAATLSSNRSRDETGTITLAALSWNGDDDLQAARTTAYGIVAAVENLLRSNPSLGLVPTFAYMVAEMGQNMTLSQAQTDVGASVLVVFDIAFKTRL